MKMSSALSNIFKRGGGACKMELKLLPVLEVSTCGKPCQADSRDVLVSTELLLALWGMGKTLICSLPNATVQIFPL